MDWYPDALVLGYITCLMNTYAARTAAYHTLVMACSRKPVIGKSASDAYMADTPAALTAPLHASQDQAIACPAAASLSRA